MNNPPPVFKNNTAFLKFLKDQDIVFIDMNFTDMNGRLHHMTEHAKHFDHGKLKDGIFFDASSLPGWKDIHESDMILRPDIHAVAMDPFAAQPTLKMFCDVYDPATNKPYNRDPRMIAKAAEAYLSSTKIADTAYFGPEPEFFIFENVRINMDPHHTGFQIDSEELPVNAGRIYDTGNTGHRPKAKGGYVPEAPIDSLSDIRGEMLTVMEAMGVPTEKHHHEVAPAQCELGMRYDTLRRCADRVQIYKHVVRNVAASYGKTATFMPKPLYGDNGSGMHVHQSLWQKDKPLFYSESGYAGLSETARHYIGGIIKHAHALNAFTNPAVNSYKRLVPGYEAPVLLAYSAHNRSAACRIPHAPSPNAKRVEIRFPDPVANPYLAFAAMLMAGLDGIQNKTDPGEAMDHNLYEGNHHGVPTVARTLHDALDALKKNHGFLLKGDVFTADMIEAYIALKEEELILYDTMVHPAEYHLYYSS